MTYLSAVFLGLIQGIAEFLPISSSGHLAILQMFLRIGDLEDHLLFDVLLHLGTLAAVFTVFHEQIGALLDEFLILLRLKRTPRGYKPDVRSRRNIGFLIIASLPLILAALFHDAVEDLTGNPFFIGFALILTGVFLFAADRLSHGNKDAKSATVSDAIVVGLAQAVAAVPGLSRSGATISAGLLRGFDREYAVEFSFLLSIPAVLGANVLSLIKAVQAGIDWSLAPMYLAGVLSAYVFGLLALRLLQTLMNRGKFGAFSFYCWGAGLLTLILSLIS